MVTSTYIPKSRANTPDIFYWPVEAILGPFLFHPKCGGLFECCHRLTQGVGGLRLYHLNKSNFEDFKMTHIPEYAI